MGSSWQNGARPGLVILVSAPAALLGAILTLSVLFAPVGLPILISMFVLCSTAVSAWRRRRWSDQARTVARVCWVTTAGMLALSCTVAIFLHRSSPLSDEHWLAIVIGWVWVAAIYMSIRSIPGPPEIDRPDVSLLRGGDVERQRLRQARPSRSGQWWLRRSWIAAVAASPLLAMIELPNATDLDHHVWAAAFLLPWCVPVAGLALFFRWMPPIRRLALAGALLIGLDGLALVAWGAWNPDNATYAPHWALAGVALLSAHLGVFVLALRKSRLLKQALLTLLVVASIVGVLAASCSDDDCLPIPFFAQALAHGLVLLVADRASSSRNAAMGVAASGPTRHSSLPGLDPVTYGRTGIHVR